ncbi:formimidoylglutamase [Flavobacterium sp.]|uniref:formimidoylglutamase n=1 Tax=Flavobacterium sp. TaxID=239 RepID=UPI00286DF40B|nr:formimidoylglutamase [Flavobacterium sp.]
MALDFLTPLNSEILDFVSNLSSQHLGSKIVFHTKDDFPDLKKIKIAIIGVLENRGIENDSKPVNLNHIRKEFFGLYPGNWNISIGDLGDIQAGNSKEDTYFALQKITSLLLKNDVFPIVIGGTQDLTYAMYRAYDDLEQMVNIVSIDSKFDIDTHSETINANSFLSKIIANEPSNLFNFSNVGFQTYFNSQEQIDLIDKLYFDAYRLGDVSNNLTLSEPVFRDADLVSLDLLSVMSSYSGNFTNFVPNGFSGKEVCVLARYAGISDKVSSFGLFNHNNSIQESVLISQVIWYFVEGFNCRSHEYPFGTKENYFKYTVTLEEDLIFYKSNITERWWIEIPLLYNSNNKVKKMTLFPCSQEDYISACNGEIPERWWKAQRKNSI